MALSKICEMMKGERRRRRRSQGCWFVFVILFMVTSTVQGQLHPGFYKTTCPNVEAIVRLAVASKLARSVVAGPATLRLFFHDCFVTGCDASVMVVSEHGDAEKDASPNLSLQPAGFQTIIEAKEAVEALCPGTVSCADIMALAARDVVVLMGGPTFEVELGRRDGMVSSASLATSNLPDVRNNVAELRNIFARNNLSYVDMIALVGGGHTVGISHCNSFSHRLYSFSETSSMDPSLRPLYSLALKAVCPPHASPLVVVPLDPTTPLFFDNGFFINVLRGKGLFASDAALMTDPVSAAVVSFFAGNRPAFFEAFADSMVKLGRAGVLTGDQGKIRTDCTSIYS